MFNQCTPFCVVGYPAESIIGTEQSLYLMLGHDSSVISVLRVCHLLLERLGQHMQESRQAAVMAEVGGCAIHTAVGAQAGVLDPLLMT